MRKIPRNRGYDKASMSKHRTALLKLDPDFKGKPLANTYARNNKLIPDFFVRSWLNYFPDTPIMYLGNECKYCGKYFAYSKKTQRFCSPKCSADSRRDIEYFGGKRRSTIGLAEGICQLCGSMPARGLASHHVWGKANDMNYLVALCPGCHKLVGDLAVRTFVDDPEQVERLIALAWMRHYGPQKMHVKATVKIKPIGNRESKSRRTIPGN